MSQTVTDRRQNYFIPLPGPTFSEFPIKEDVEYKVIDVPNLILEFPIIPYPGRLYVVQAEVEKSKGLYIPVSAQKDGEMQTNYGWVIAIGKDITFCELGDKVFYGRYSGSWVMDMTYKVLNEEDLLGKYKESEE